MVAAEADATVLVVSRGEQRPTIQRCMERLDSVGGRIAGIVFNHATTADMVRSSYGSVNASHGRAAAGRRVRPIDADTSDRFGPLATAVASYAVGEGEEDAELAGTNGHNRRNGHPFQR